MSFSTNNFLDIKLKNGNTIFSGFGKVTQQNVYMTSGNFSKGAAIINPNIKNETNTPAPTAPTAGQINSATYGTVTSNSITINITGTYDTFNIIRTNLLTNAIVNVNGQTGTTYVDNTVFPNYDYSYSIIPINKGVTGQTFSLTDTWTLVSVTTSPPTISSGSVRINWSGYYSTIAVIRTSTIPIGFPSGAHINFSTSSSQQSNVNGYVTDTGLTNGTTYTYTIAATNGGGVTTQITDSYTAKPEIQYIAALPSMSAATLYGSIGEPGTYSLTISGQNNNTFNGTYYTTGSSFNGGNTSSYPPNQPFSPEPTSNYPVWLTRTGINNYPKGTPVTTAYGSAFINNYSGSTSTTLANSTRLSGEWIQIQCPNSFTALAYSVYPCFLGKIPHDNNYIQMVNSWYLLGSNNSAYSKNPTNWVIIDTKTSYYANISTTDMFPLSTNTSSYNMYRIVISSMCNTNLTAPYGVNAASGQIQFYI